MFGRGGRSADVHGRASLDESQRQNLETLATRMRRIVVGEFPELYLRVNEVRAQFEIAGKGLKKGGVVESEKKLAHALRRLNSAKFCLEVALVEVAEVLELPPAPGSPSEDAPGGEPAVLGPPQRIRRGMPIGEAPPVRSAHSQEQDRASQDARCWPPAPLAGIEPTTNGLEDRCSVR